MDWSTIWKFLHIAAMFVAVSIFVGQGMLSGAVARSGDVRAVRRILEAEDRFAPIGGGLFLLGIVFAAGTAPRARSGGASTTAAPTAPPISTSRRGTRVERSRTVSGTGGSAMRRR
ncbi:MAG TPA: hypothetical protein VFI35_11160 [Actinomycetota bacterium]|nr:hypothetical protein [Actinomycetota bacterium]